MIVILEAWSVRAATWRATAPSVSFRLATADIFYCFIAATSCKLEKYKIMFQLAHPEQFKSDQQWTGVLNYPPFT